ncbi:MAG TPA: leucine--tRNA ligase [Bdellovibrionales bacterium]|nr:leucine--tRNA ligase [Bdellovibrionales bacterium]
MSYNHREIDERWQKTWEEKQVYKADNSSSKPKYYALDMFPYPSGSGLHIGHMASYTPTDVISRYKRNRGFNVLHPMGYDAFGLPAEQYAIQTGVHPAKTTEAAITSFRKTLKSFGFSFDWSREISTADPAYYKWTQFIFEKLFERGLAYQKEVPVNWCPALRTVLANDEVVDGKSERGGHPIVRKPMKQWMIKITDYAERLLQDLELVDWPERTKEAQRNWIGKSEGASVRFHVHHHPGYVLEVFTTRPDTLFGVSFMVIAPEHPLIQEITTVDQRKAVDAYVEASSRKLEVDRKAATDKTGVFTGAYAIHPLNGKQIPIWTADYVLMDYGTGAIMAVPGHDARDFEFAEKFKLEIIRVLESDGPLPFEGEGKMVNSDFLNGLSKTEAIQKMISELEKRALGTRKVEYKLRDWLFSRQRYWGEPFPIVRLSDGTLRAVPENELPVVLPDVANYEPSDAGEAPLARNTEWMKYRFADGAEGMRETDTMPGSAGSSWYFLRYCDPHNSKELVSQAAQKYWMPVDLYVGGPEHTVGHLLYARFWNKILFDAGIVSSPEPFKRLAHQGMLLGPDGEKMSKSRGNVINPDDVRDRYGADALRMYILFLGPMDRDKPWSENGIDGVSRFLDRLWRATVSEDGKSLLDDSEPSPELNKLLHKTIKKVGEDIEVLGFNTAISSMMILLNEIYKQGSKSRKVLRDLVVLVSPFAPHLAEEIWQKIDESGYVVQAPWPGYDSNLTVDDVVNIGVQVNGKSRGAIEIGKEAPEADAVAEAMKLESVKNAVAGKPVDKVIYKAGRILNLIVK